ncbi:MAG: hypothetical protein AB1629_05745 [Candidatus Omnitrophota bacterium]
MKNKLILFLILFFISSICFAQDIDKSQPLQLFIKSDKEVYMSGEEIKVELDIDNTSDVPFFLSEEDISLDVEDKSKAINLIAPFFSPTFIPQEHNLLEIRPHSSYKKVFNFDKWQINIQEKGEHLGAAYYTNEFPNRYLIQGTYVYPPDTTIAARTFPGPLTSNTIQIEVRGKKQRVELQPIKSKLVPQKGVVYHIIVPPQLHETHEPGPAEQNTYIAWRLANEFVFRTELREYYVLPSQSVGPQKSAGEYMVSFVSRKGDKQLIIRVDINKNEATIINAKEQFK